MKGKEEVGAVQFLARPTACDTSLLGGEEKRPQGGGEAGHFVHWPQGLKMSATQGMQS